MRLLPTLLVFLTALLAVSACAGDAGTAARLVQVTELDDSAGPDVPSRTDASDARGGVDSDEPDLLPDVQPETAACSVDDDCAYVYTGHPDCGEGFCDAGTCAVRILGGSPPCGDDDPCISEGYCDQGRCVGITRNCDDRNPCTDDACDPAGTGCIYTDRQSACEDGFACTIGDYCDAGLCLGGANECLCATDADCAQHDDGNPCNGHLRCDDGFCAVDPATVILCDGSADGDCLFTECDPTIGACVTAPLPDGTECSDGNSCTGNDRCVAGACRGPLLPCDDGNACTNDGCDRDTGCIHEPADLLCDDNSECTTGDHCGEGTCAGRPTDCDDRNPCTADTCDPSSGCVSTPLSGAACDDGFACTVDDHCLDGSCVSTRNDCTCAADEDCVAFDDGNLCNGAPGCVDGRCRILPQSIVRCPEPEPDSCTMWVCAPATGECSPDGAPDGWACDDGDPCTVRDECTGGTCRGHEVECDDGEPCTRGFCDSGAGICRFEPVARGCDDGNPCTVGDTCHEGECSPGTAIDCDDDTPCTLDSCTPTEGCVHAPNSGPCSDGNDCTTGDTCVDGTCVGVPGACSCGTDADCAPYDDGDACNGALTCRTDVPQPFCDVDPNTVVFCDPSLDTDCAKNRCDADSGACVLNPVREGEPCDDGDPCTTETYCARGECQATAVLDCDDHNPCTNDRCSSESGCINEPREGDCDDGNPCSVGDHCEGGVCVAVQIVNCDDGNGCTEDICLPGGDCSFTALPYGTPCDDGDPDTVADQCGLATDCGGWRFAALAREGIQTTRITDVSFNRINTTLIPDSAVFVTVDEGEDGADATWIARIRGTSIQGVSALLAEGSFVAIESNLAVGRGGLLYWYDGRDWSEAEALWDELDLGSELTAVHGYATAWSAGYIAQRTTFYLGTTPASGVPEIARCFWTAGILGGDGSWSCDAFSVGSPGGGIAALLGTREAQSAGADDATAWAIWGAPSTAANPRDRIFSRRPGDTDWSDTAPDGCNGGQTTPCARNRWESVFGLDPDDVWAVGGAARVLRNYGEGWTEVPVPTEVLFPGSRPEDYTFKDVRSTSEHVHIVGEWTGCPDGPCDAPTTRRLVYLHHHFTTGRWDPVRTLAEVSCGTPAPSAACEADTLSRLEVTGLDFTDSYSRELYVVGSRPDVTSGGTTGTRGLILHLDLR